MNEALPKTECQGYVAGTATGFSRRSSRPWIRYLLIISLLVNLGMMAGVADVIRGRGACDT